MASGLSGGEDTGFSREISIKKYGCDDPDMCPENAGFVLVESKVSWNDGGREVVLSGVMTDWKGGAL